jgi:hypothetical protein
LLVPASLVALLAASASAPADELVLRNGRTLEGEVTEAGDTVVFRRPGISMEIRKDEVLEIRKTPAPKEQYAKRSAELDRADAAAAASGTKDAKGKGDAEAHHRLGLWCATKGLKDEACAEQRKAVAIDPDHAGARRALGFMKTDAGWRLEDEVMAEKGLVRFEGRWMAKEEADALAKGGEPSAQEKARRELRDGRRRMRKSLNAALRSVADPDPRTRVQGEKDLVAVAREMGETGLEAKAPELRAYYDQAYEEIASARALVQVHAQVVTLKRPIRTFTTSLGAASTPVTLQLPELSVISINTTALLPLSVDEE